jgi:hypothetical protein
MGHGDQSPPSRCPHQALGERLRRLPVCLHSSSREQPDDLQRRVGRNHVPSDPVLHHATGRDHVESLPSWSLSSESTDARRNRGPEASRPQQIDGHDPGQSPKRPLCVGRLAAARRVAGPDEQRCYFVATAVLLRPPGSAAAAARAARAGARCSSRRRVSRNGEPRRRPRGAPSLSSAGAGAERACAADCGGARGAVCWSPPRAIAADSVDSGGSVRVHVRDRGCRELGPELVPRLDLPTYTGMRREPVEAGTRVEPRVGGARSIPAAASSQRGVGARPHHSVCGRVTTACAFDAVRSSPAAAAATGASQATAVG